MNVLIWSVFIFIFICFAWYVYRFVEKEDQKEHFTNGSSVSLGLEESIIQIYNDVLHREPSASELIQNTRDLNGKKITLEGLRQRLMDSEEYIRLIKLQSNSLTPELPKVIADRSLIQLIRKIYQEERNTPIPEEMILPLKDTYIWLNYNEYAFRAFLRNKDYATFEEDAQRTAQLDQESLVILLEKSFEKETLTTQGVTIAEEMKKEGKPVNENVVTSNSSGSSSTVHGTISASGVSTARTLNDMDSDMTPMVDRIMLNAKSVFNKDEAAKMLTQRFHETQLPVQTHYGQMVLRADQSWTVPQRPPPVCTTLGQKPMIMPMMNNSKLLLGTSLEDSVDTEVGSIMPKFEYKEYVPLMVME